jgi:hypothetical protein
MRGGGGYFGSVSDPDRVNQLIVQRERLLGL